MALQMSCSSWDHICSRGMVEQNGNCLCKIEIGPPAKAFACVMITGAMRTTPTKVLWMLLDLQQLGTWLKLQLNSSIPPTKTKPKDLKNKAPPDLDEGAERISADV